VDFIYSKNYEDYIPKAKALYEKYADKIILPLDLAGVTDGERREYKIDEVPEDLSAIDIGKETIEKYRALIMSAKTVFVNGPMGVFEQAPSEAGTKAVFEALADTEAYTVVGGGDSVTAARKYKVSDRLGYVCTGGGALIRFLTGEELPVVKALRHAAEIF
jgi:phosphoglycerate kinase